MQSHKSAKPTEEGKPTTCFRIVVAGSAYFVLVFGAGFVFGSMRVPFLVPHVGDRTAELLEMPLMLLVVVAAARFICRRFALPAQTAIRLCTGFVGLALLVCAEFMLAAILRDLSPGDYVASQDPVSGTAFALTLALFGLMPFFLACAQRARERHEASSE